MSLHLVSVSFTQLIGNMAKGWCLFFLIVSISALITICNASQPYQEQVCTFYGENRTPKEAYSLSNCTWFKDRSCCKRTEVTSVFQEMMPIDTSNKDCYNHMNYLMCYFCNPDQYKWFRNGKLHICREFCDDVYEHCKDAKNEGKTIGSTYSGGKAFCAAQAFIVVDDNEDCFEFDSSHFSISSKVTALTLLVLSASTILFLV